MDTISISFIIWNLIRCHKHFMTSANSLLRSKED